MIKRFLKDEMAQGMTEYILLVFLIAIAAYAAVGKLGKTVKTKFEKAESEVARAR